MAAALPFALGVAALRAAGLAAAFLAGAALAAAALPPLAAGFLAAAAPFLEVSALVAFVSLWVRLAPASAFLLSS